jgi:hypothetical protein
MKGRLRIDARYSKELKSLIFDLFFSEKKFSELAKEYRNVDGKKFFTNSEKFNLRIVQERNNTVAITDKDINREFDNFLARLTRVPCELKEQNK